MKSKTLSELRAENKRLKLELVRTRERVYRAQESCRDFSETVVELVKPDRDGVWPEVIEERRK